MDQGDRVEACDGPYGHNWRPAIISRHNPYRLPRGSRVVDGYDIHWDFEAEGVKQEQWHSAGGWCPTDRIRQRGGVWMGGKVSCMKTKGSAS